MSPWVKLIRLAVSCPRSDLSPWSPRSHDLKLLVTANPSEFRTVPGPRKLLSKYLTGAESDTLKTWGAATGPGLIDLPLWYHLSWGLHSCFPITAQTCRIEYSKKHKGSPVWVPIRCQRCCRHPPIQDWPVLAWTPAMETGVSQGHHGVLGSTHCWISSSFGPRHSLTEQVSLSIILTT